VTELVLDWRIWKAPSSKRRTPSGKAAESYVELSGLKDPGSVRLEEVELLDEKGQSYWLITLSRPIDGDPAHIVQALRNPEGRREYKIFKVLADSGRVVSMKIRQV
jgi:hypothetical protein